MKLVYFLYIHLFNSVIHSRFAPNKKDLMDILGDNLWTND